MSRIDNGIAISLLSGRTIVSVDTPSTVDGATLVARVISAMARDVLASALVKLTEQGYQVVMHNQDEIVVELREDSELEDNVEVVSRTMIAAGDIIKGLRLPLSLDVETKTDYFYY